MAVHVCAKHKEHRRLINVLLVVAQLGKFGAFFGVGDLNDGGCLNEARGGGTLPTKHQFLHHFLRYRLIGKGANGSVRLK
jgi:hypothetical protein